MTLQPHLADSDLQQGSDLTRLQLERLVRELLVGRKIDIVTFVRELLTVVGQVREIHCRLAVGHGLRFELRGRDPFEVELDASLGKLRMLCAHLAVLSKASDHDPLIYGGAGVIRQTWQAKQSGTQHESKFAAMQTNEERLQAQRGATQYEPVNCPPCKAVWTNTPDKQEFTIVAE